VGEVSRAYRRGVGRVTRRTWLGWQTISCRAPRTSRPYRFRSPARRV